MGILVIKFLILTFIVVCTAMKLSHNAEIIEANSKFNPIFMGLILAAVTSLPELVSGLTSVHLGDNSIAVSNILGSNIFNIFALACFNLIYFRKKIFRGLKKGTLDATKYAVVMYIIFIVVVMGNNLGIINEHILRFSLASLIMSGIYLFSIYSSSGADDDKVKPEMKASMIRVKGFFALEVIVIVGASMLLSTVAEDIVAMTSLSSGAVGAILIGVATSLPEIVTCGSLIKNGKNEMAITSVIGSNTFNFMSLTIFDYVSSQSIYMNLDEKIIIYAMFGLLCTLILMFREQFNYRAYIVPPVAVVAIYLVMVSISI